MYGLLISGTDELLVSKHQAVTEDVVVLFVSQLLILAAWFGMTIVGLIVLGAIKDEHLSAGNPYRLTNTIDYEGNICGIDHGVKNKGKGYYLPDLTGTTRAGNQNRDSSCLISLHLLTNTVYFAC